jgi:hypothetical protein
MTVAESLSLALNPSRTSHLPLPLKTVPRKVGDSILDHQREPRTVLEIESDGGCDADDRDKGVGASVVTFGSL